MAVAAKLYRDDRGAERHAVQLDATLRDARWRPLDVLIDDLSAAGFRMATDEPLAPGSVVSVGIAGLGRHDATVVRHGVGHYGCRFVSPIPESSIRAAPEGPSVVQADFGQPANQWIDPPLDAGELRLRRFRGPILLAGLIGPWALGALALRALLG